MPKAVHQVYRNNPRSLEDLKDAVKPVVRRLPLSVCCAAAEVTLRRAKQSIERNGGHIENGVPGVAQYGDRRRSKFPKKTPLIRLSDDTWLILITPIHPEIY